MADTLNASQLEAVRWKGGPLIVLAGPGTGKTRVIAHRVRWLVEQGATPESIVAVTYTVKAAHQLRERLTESLGPERADRVNVHTFHGLGMRLLRRFGDVLGLPASPDLIDSAQSKRMLRELVNEHRLFPEAIASGRDAAIERAATVMGVLEDHAVDPAEALSRAETWALRAREIKDEAGQAELARAEEFRGQAKLYDLYDKARRRRGWLSYGDLITLPIRLLAKDGRAAMICRGEFKHFIVDEFQDSNPAQLALLRQLAPSKSADVCVVGDDDQSIYAFRGADDRAFEHFRRAWPSAGEVRLSENYRSAPGIVAATNRIISLAPHRFAPDKTITAAGSHATPGLVECVPLPDDFADGTAIAAAILSDRAANPARSSVSQARVVTPAGRFTTDDEPSPQFTMSVKESALPGSVIVPVSVAVPPSLRAGVIATLAVRVGAGSAEDCALAAVVRAPARCDTRVVVAATLSYTKTSCVLLASVTPTAAVGELLTKTV